MVYNKSNLQQHKRIAFVVKVTWVFNWQHWISTKYKMKPTKWQLHRLEPWHTLWFK